MTIVVAFKVHIFIGMLSISKNRTDNMKIEEFKWLLSVCAFCQLFTVVLAVIKSIVHIISFS